VSPDGSASVRDLAVVIVLYNSADVLAGCLESIPDGVEVVVNNASADGGADRARELRPEAVIVRSGRNLGFGGGCNVGWRAAGRPYVAFINPDVRVRAGALELLVARLAAAPGNVFGPALLDAGGVARRCKRHPSLSMDVCGLLPSAERWAPIGWDGKLGAPDPRHARGGPVACVEGACFVIARTELEALGGFDEDLFLYYEEESLSLRLARRGGQAIYEPSAVVDHVGGTSVEKVAGLATRHLHRSRVIFYRKRDGELRGRLGAVALALAAGAGAGAALVNHVLGRRRQTPLPYWGHVLQGLAAGFMARLTNDPAYRPTRL
jgi:N-acetylglucosaminyl-diphospho-decaprenol L-rhamnosyltransferase